MNYSYSNGFFFILLFRVIYLYQQLYVFSVPFLLLIKPNLISIFFNSRFLISFFFSIRVLFPFFIYEIFFIIFLLFFLFYELIFSSFLLFFCFSHTTSNIVSASVVCLTSSVHLCVLFSSFLFVFFAVCVQSVCDCLFCSFLCFCAFARELREKFFCR